MRRSRIILLTAIPTLALCLGLLGALSPASAPIPRNLANSQTAVAATPDIIRLAATPGRIFLPLVNHPAATTSPPPATPLPSATPTLEHPPLRLAVIGDFGSGNENAARVAALVNGWDPDFIVTTGDNNYPDGEAATIDENIGQLYGQYIGNYQGDYGPGSPTNRFWPSLGNHDWHTITCTGDTCTGAHFDYFTLPGNERYYDVDLGLVHLFAIDSDSDEPDGREPDSIQAAWLQERLSASSACYQLVYFHHAAYSTGRHGSNSKLQWPFASWGADAVLNGHMHAYERLDVAGTPFFVNGAGGANLYKFEDLRPLPPEATSILRYDQDHGAMLVTATTVDITYQFYSAEGVLIDELTVTAEGCQLAYGWAEFAQINAGPKNGGSQ